MDVQRVGFVEAILVERWEQAGLWYIGWVLCVGAVDGRWMQGLGMPPFLHHSTSRASHSCGPMRARGVFEFVFAATKICCFKPIDPVFSGIFSKKSQYTPRP